MTVPIVRSGGCACGAVRYATHLEPIRVSACHCTQCQRRTGSAFGVGCYFPAGQVEILQGSTKSFQRDSEAGRWVRNHFCEHCGNPVFWELEVLPQVYGISAGCFDDTTWIHPKLHVWTESAQHWFQFPANAEVLQKSNIADVNR